MKKAETRFTHRSGKTSKISQKQNNPYKRNVQSKIQSLLTKRCYTRHGRLQAIYLYIQSWSA